MVTPLPKGGKAIISRECGENPQLCRSGDSPKTDQRIFPSRTLTNFSGTRSFFMGKERAVAYNIDFDIRPAVKRESDHYIQKQMETHIGERFNVLLSAYRMEVRGQTIFGHNINEPFLDTLKRGQKYRKIHGNPADQRREEAEVVGFGKIQDTLANPETKTGTIMLSISPSGDERSDYIHNFYDIFTLSEDESGRFIEGKRYNSVLTPVETVKRLKEKFEIDNLPFPNDVSLLSNPILIPTGNAENADDIHALLHQKHDYLNSTDFDYLKRAIKPFIETYKKALLTGDRAYIDDSYDAVLNHADDIWEDLQETNDKEMLVLEFLARGLPTREEILIIGNRPVRQTMTGCGSSGGSGKDKSSRSVAEFGSIDRGYEFDQPGPCQQCGRDVPCGPCHICESCVVASEQSLSAE